MLLVRKLDLGNAWRSKVARPRLEGGDWDLARKHNGITGLHVAKNSGDPDIFGA
jgi:hypothetical protein